MCQFWHTDPLYLSFTLELARLSSSSLRERAARVMNLMRPQLMLSIPAEVNGGRMSNSSRVSGVGRRSFLARSAMATGVVGVGGMFSALVARGPQRPRNGRGPSPDYGPLEPAIDETTGLPLLLLPNAFR